MRKIIFDKLYVLFAAVLCLCLTACPGNDDLNGNESQAQQNGNGGTNAPQVYPQDGNPLTLEAIGSGTITFKNRAAGPVSYRIGNGNVQTIAAGTDGQIPVSAGQKISFFGDNATYSSIDEYSKFSSTTDFYAYGNIMSLISSKGYSSATKLTESYTFCSLFEGATLLKSHPNIPLLLPATILSEGCYNSMFSGCTSLTTAPVLPAKTLADHCYYCYDYMFYGCSSLNYVKCLAEGDVDNFLFTDSWLEGVAPSGTFVKAPGAPWNKVSSSCIPSGWTVVENTEEPTTDPGEEGVEPVYPDINSTPLTLEAIADGTITFKNYAAGSVIYKIDGGESQTIKSKTTKTIDVIAGQKVRFFGDNSAYYNDVFSYSNISSTADFYVYGNIMSLVNSKNYANTIKLTKEYTFAYLFEGSIHLRNHPSHQLVLPATTLTQYCYFRMFNGCTSLTTPSVLPANKLAPHCYHFMYSFCTNLTTAPELPATTLAENCYWGMFYGCTSLTTAPELPATTLAKGCYRQMFDDCTSLTTAPELPATTLAETCYYCMFKGCSALTTAPELPATTLKKECYGQMFYGAGLTTAPKLPAITLAELCYIYMFKGCSALTTAPELPAKTLTRKCYYEMFNGCTSLKYVKCLATNKSATDCTTDWLKNTSTTGTFVKKSGTSWASGSSGIPTGWSITSD